MKIKYMRSKENQIKTERKKLIRNEENGSVEKKEKIEK